jgi:hypothetical protein
MFNNKIVFYIIMNNIENPNIIININDIPSLRLPYCVCPYFNGHKYMLVEINTGLYNGNIKKISRLYDNFEDTCLIYYEINSIYPLLKNHLII